jgi:F0F1-type ATP synthase membrane subunit b/b'
MKNTLALTTLLALSSSAFAEENEAETLSLSQWLEENGGEAGVELMMAEEAKSEAKAEAEKVLDENPEEAAALKHAAQDAIERCKSTGFGSLPNNDLEGMNDADLAVSVSFPIDDIFDGDWSTGTFSAGSKGYGVSANTGILWNDPGTITDCVQQEISEAVDKIIEEKDKLMSGDFSTVKAALGAAAAKLAIDEAYKVDNEFGEMLETLEKVCTTGGNCF